MCTHTLYYHSIQCTLQVHYICTCAFVFVIVLSPLTITDEFYCILFHFRIDFPEYFLFVMMLVRVYILQFSYILYFPKDTPQRCSIIGHRAGQRAGGLGPTEIHAKDKLAHYARACTDLPRGPKIRTHFFSPVDFVSVITESQCCTMCIFFDLHRGSKIRTGLVPLILFKRF